MGGRNAAPENDCEGVSMVCSEEQRALLIPRLLAAMSGLKLVSMLQVSVLPLPLSGLDDYVDTIGTGLFHRRTGCCKYCEGIPVLELEPRPCKRVCSAPHILLQNNPRPSSGHATSPTLSGASTAAARRVS